MYFSIIIIILSLRTQYEQIQAWSHFNTFTTIYYYVIHICIKQQMIVFSSAKFGLFAEAIGRCSKDFLLKMSWIPLAQSLIKWLFSFLLFYKNMPWYTGALCLSNNKIFLLAHDTRMPEYLEKTHTGRTDKPTEGPWLNLTCTQEPSCCGASVLTSG